ncbi:MAG: GvpL/GvpF family gas vesicle protein, partial [candidate division NC10 bacterium]
VEIKRNKPRTEREAANLACLVGRDGREQFEAAVFEAAKLFDNSYAFDYNGPWAPHNFVDLTLDL